MKYLNLGCGNHYSTAQEWTNIDFVSSGKNVIAHNLLKGIDFPANTFDLVYHSHVLEHFSKIDGENLIIECFRVLKPGGILRIAIPDLEQISKKYLQYLELGIQNPNDEIVRANYEWMKIEMYDQTVRNFSGGLMGQYLFQDKIINENFIFERIGEEGKAIRQNYLNAKTNKGAFLKTIQKNSIKKKILDFKNKIKSNIKKIIFDYFKINPELISIGNFRLGGEIHQWMYDRYSLTKLLSENGGIEIEVKTAFSSYLENWSNYSIDGIDPVTRKPDSLFIECFKK